MNNTLSTALVILAVLWLVRDVNTLETKRRPGKSDFFFDDTTTPLVSSTPWSNLANSFPTQRTQPTPEDDNKPQSSQSFPGNIGSLGDMWKLLQQVMSMLNPLAASAAKDPPDEDSTKPGRKVSPKVNLTVTTSAYGDIDLDEITIEYASGNDSFDDEDYEYSVNFSSPNPQTVLTSQSLDVSSYVTPKVSNEDVSEQSNIEEPFAKDPGSTNPDKDSKVSKFPDVTDGIEDELMDEFIDDYINNHPREVPDENNNSTSPTSEGNEMEPTISTPNPRNVTSSGTNDETSSTKTEVPISPEIQNVTSQPPIQNQIKVYPPSVNSNNPEDDTTSETASVSPLEDNPLQNVTMSTEIPFSTDRDETPDNDKEKSASIPLQKNTTPPSPLKKPLKRPNLKKKQKRRKVSTSTKAPTDKQKGLQKTVPSTALPPKEGNNNLTSVNPFSPTQMQLPQPQKSTNQILFDKPSFLVNPYNNPFIANLTPPELTQSSNKTEIPKPENPLNKSENQSNSAKPLSPQDQKNMQQGPTTESKPPFNKPKVPSPQDQLNKTEPPRNQNNDDKPVTPQNKTNSELSPLDNNPQNVSSLTPEDKKSFATFLNEFPRIKALLPKIANIPFLQAILGNTSDTPPENCTDAEGLLVQNDLTTEEPTQQDLPPIVFLTTSLPTALPTTELPTSFNASKITPSKPDSVTTPSSVQQSTKTTTVSPPATVTPEIDCEEDYDSDSNEEPSSDEYNEDTEDNADDEEEDEDDTEDDADDTDEDVDDKYGDTEEADEYQEEIDDLSVFDDFQKVSTVIPSSTTTQLPLVTTPSVFDKKNCTPSPTKATTANTLKPPKKFHSILEYLYDNSRNPLFANIRKLQNKTMS